MTKSMTGKLGPGQVATHKRLGKVKPPPEPTKATAFLDLMSKARRFIDRQSEQTFNDLDVAVSVAKKLGLY